MLAILHFLIHLSTSGLQPYLVHSAAPIGHIHWQDDALEVIYSILHHYPLSISESKIR